MHGIDPPCTLAVESDGPVCLVTGLAVLGSGVDAMVREAVEETSVYTVAFRFQPESSSANRVRARTISR